METAVRIVLTPTATPGRSSLIRDVFLRYTMKVWLLIHLLFSTFIQSNMSVCLDHSLVAAIAGGTGGAREIHASKGQFYLR